MSRRKTYVSSVCMLSGGGLLFLGSCLGGPGCRGARDDMRQTCSTNRSLMWQVWVSPLPILYLLFHKVDLLCPFLIRAVLALLHPPFKGYYNMHTTLLQDYLSLPAERPHCKTMLLVRHIWRGLKSDIISL